MRGVLRKVGSLKLAVVLLLALAVAMALASVYETRHGTEAALRDYYRSLWFAAILAAIGVNAAAALAVRWPFRRSQTGFVIAHVSILFVLIGALITRLWGVDGQLWLRPDDVRADFDGDGWVLRLNTPDAATPEDRVEVPVDDDGPRFDPSAAGQQVDGVSWAIEQYAADTIDEGQRVIADPNGPGPAVKVRLGHGSHQHEEWVMGEHPVRVAGLQLRLFRIPDPTALKQLLAPTSAPSEPTRGRLVVHVRDQRFEVDLDAQQGQTVPLGRTGYRVRLRQYLPHAQVSGREVRSVTSRPVNPMIAFDLIDATGEATLHRLFARFPDQDFAADHATQTAPSTAPATQPVTFSYAGATVVSRQSNRIDLLMDRDGGLHARFTDAFGRVSSAGIALNRPIPTPWQETRLTALTVLPRARNERALKPIPPRRQHAVPAAFVRLSTPRTAHRLWVRRGESYDVHLDGRHVQLSYAPPRIPLGFSIKLLAPIITNYPGSDRARTYESRVLIEDAQRGVTLDRTISMNAPLEYGGYAFYQSSYQFGQHGEPIATMLSVVSDRGEPVVYVGYAGLLLGLIVTLAQQVAGRARRRSRAADA